MDLPIKDTRFFQNVAKVDVCIEEIRIQRNGLFKMMNGQPDFALGIEDTTQIGPGNGKIGSRFNRL